MDMPTDRESAVVEILLVEDSQDDADLMSDALREGSLNPHITVVDNGEDAIDFLYRRGEFSAAREPDLVLLDLSLPRKNGHEVLAEIKQDALLRRIPIVILTSERDENAIRLAYDLYANCCVTKPADQEQFMQAVKKIETFWIRVSRRK
jgi:two-component system, chemotaxis family, response regulator Rcp1